MMQRNADLAPSDFQFAARIGRDKLDWWLRWDAENFCAEKWKRNGVRSLELESRV
jgi:hypothetical protein